MLIRVWFSLGDIQASHCDFKREIRQFMCSWENFTHSYSKCFFRPWMVLGGEVCELRLSFLGHPRPALQILCQKICLTNPSGEYLHLLEKCPPDKLDVAVLFYPLKWNHYNCNIKKVNVELQHCIRIHHMSHSVSLEDMDVVRPSNIMSDQTVKPNIVANFVTAISAHNGR